MERDVAKKLLVVLAIILWCLIVIFELLNLHRFLKR